MSLPSCFVEDCAWYGRNMENETVAGTVNGPSLCVSSKRSKGERGELSDVVIPFIEEITE